MSSAEVSVYLTDASCDIERDSEELPDPSYIVCSTPRSGSTLLCQALNQLGLGVPTEYFNVLHRTQLSQRWGCSTLDSYLRCLYRHRVSVEGVFGSKLHWDQFVALYGERTGTSDFSRFELSGNVCAGMFPNAKYIQIIRTDIYAQSVSHWVAIKNGRWWAKNESETRDEMDLWDQYSFEEIDLSRRHLEKGELRWSHFFLRNGIQPLVVVYEDLASNYSETVALAAEFLGRKVDPKEIEDPTLSRQANDLSKRLRERYLDDIEKNGVEKSFEDCL